MRVARDVREAFPSNWYAFAALIAVAVLWGITAYLLNVAPTAP